MRLSFIRNSNGLIFALIAAIFGLFLFTIGLAERSTEGRHLVELTLLAPLLLYALGSSRKRKR